MSQNAATSTDAKRNGSSLREAFPGYFPPGKEAIGTFLTSGLVVFDTNPLLDAYKLTGTARTEFLAALRALGDRLWIPHQVGLEFLRNRASVIDHGSGFPDRFRKAAGNLHKEVQQLKEHRGLKDEDVSGITQAIDDAVTDILNAHAALYDFGIGQGVAIDDDPVFKEIEQIIAGKVGPSLPNIVEATKIGKQRLKDKVPPGYSDVPEKGEEGALGDYFVWAQTLTEAKRRGLPVLLVTNENKGDWIRTEGSYKRGPRAEMVEEMLREAGQPFYLMNVRSFLFHAGQHLAAKVSDSTIAQAESVQMQVASPTVSVLQELLGNQLDNVLRVNDLLAEMPPKERAILRRLLGGGTASVIASPDHVTKLLSALTALHMNGDVQLLGTAGGHYHLRLDDKDWGEEKTFDEIADPNEDESGGSDE
ncbi:UNVERIFIED_ORG: hypothetical protein FHR35_004455 [Microbispora rosea subsp. rosea]